MEMDPVLVSMVNGQGEGTLDISDLSPNDYVIFAISDYRRGAGVLRIIPEQENSSGSSSAGSSSYSLSELFDIFNPSDENEDSENNNIPELETEEDPLPPETEEDIDEEELELEIDLEYIINVDSLCLTMQSTKALRIWNKVDNKEPNRLLQSFLNNYEYNAGPEDGDFGPGTQSALIQFQSDNGLIADGIFGTGTAVYIENNCGDLKKKSEIVSENEAETSDSQGTEDQEIQSSEDDTTWFGDVVDSIGDWFQNTWLGGWLGLGTRNTGVSTGIQHEPTRETFEEKFDVIVTNKLLEEAFGITTSNEILTEINRLLPVYQIDTQEKLAHFLSQIAHESKFKPIEEGWRYNKSALLKVFGCKSVENSDGEWIKQWDYIKNTCKPGFKKRVDTLWKNPEFYVKSENLFKEVYSNKYGNGDFKSGDGFKYRGKGLIQLTWKDNYAEFTKKHNKLYFSDQQDFVKTPELLLSSDIYSTRAAFFYWNSRNINSVSEDSSANSIKQVTYKINGGYNGLDDRKKKFWQIYPIIQENKIYE